MPDPSERTAEAVKSSRTESYPGKNRTAGTSVAGAVSESDRTISLFRLYLSARIPAKGKIRKEGRNPHTTDRVIMTPDFVSGVICHVMAY